MATYTATLSRKYPQLATYLATTLQHASVAGTWTPASITPPTWNSGRKAFRSYACPDMVIVTRSGTCTGFITSNVTATENWDTLAPAAIVRSDGDYVAEIVYDAGVWYSDYQGGVALDSDHPIVVPKKELHRFIGCYSTNATTGTKYINADGTPTPEFLALAPTDDITIYAQFETASVKITISSAYGDFAFKTFYQSLTADADGKYGYFTDSACTPESRIYGIPIPIRELYRWLGAFSSSSSTTHQYIDGVFGDFTQEFLDRSPSQITIYGNRWEKIASKITINANGGVAPSKSYYSVYAEEYVADAWPPEDEAYRFEISQRSEYRFLGYFSSTTGTTKYVDYDGSYDERLETRTSNTTIYAQWRKASAEVLLDAGTGSGGGTVYYDGADRSFFNAASATITSVPVPTDFSNVFIGFFTEPDGGVEVIPASGVIPSTFAPSSNTTLYAHWIIRQCTIKVDRGDGAGGTELFYYDKMTGYFYGDEALTRRITSVTLPSLRLFRCTGLYTSATTGYPVVYSSGTIDPDWAPDDEETTIYAQYERRCFETVLDTGGGSFDLTAIYHAPSGSSWFSDDSLTNAVTNIGVHPRTGYTFGGLFYGGNQVIGTDGSILSSAFTGEDYNATAQWTAKTYTLTFNAYPATPSFASKTVTFDAPIGTLPTATIKGRRLDGWSIEGVNISATDVWTFDSSRTANANWHDSFGGVTDYFKLETANGPLMLVSSNSGATRTVIETSHTGKIDTATAFGLLLNPVCTYRIRKEGRVSILLGAAWAGSGTKKSGYMLTNAEYATAADGEPVLVVRGVANEGAPAINRWSVTLDVNPDHIAQDPMGAVSGGGELTECKTLITCDPVVPMENGMPCASDIVHGKVVVTATTNAYGDENAPTAGGGFLETNGVPLGDTDVDFTTYAFSAERSL